MICSCRLIIDVLALYLFWSTESSRIKIILDINFYLITILCHACISKLNIVLRNFLQNVWVFGICFITYWKLFSWVLYKLFVLFNEKMTSLHVRNLSAQVREKWNWTGPSSCGSRRDMSRWILPSIGVFNSKLAYEFFLPTLSSYQLSSFLTHNFKLKGKKITK